MGHRMKEFCYCDGCGVEQGVTSGFTAPAVPDKWVTIIPSGTNTKAEHLCQTCWTIGVNAIYYADATNKRLKDGST